MLCWEQAIQGDHATWNQKRWHLCNWLAEWESQLMFCGEKLSWKQSVMAQATQSFKLQNHQLPSKTPASGMTANRIVHKGRSLWSMSTGKADQSLLQRKNNRTQHWENSGATSHGSIWTGYSKDNQRQSLHVYCRWWLLKIYMRGVVKVKSWSEDGASRTDFESTEWEELPSEADSERQWNWVLQRTNHGFMRRLRNQSREVSS